MASGVARAAQQQNKCKLRFKQIQNRKTTHIENRAQNRNETPTMYKHTVAVHMRARFCSLLFLALSHARTLRRFFFFMKYLCLHFCCCSYNTVVIITITHG